MAVNIKDFLQCLPQFLKVRKYTTFPFKLQAIFKVAGFIFQNSFSAKTKNINT